MVTREPPRALRARLIDWLLVIAAVIGTLWLGSLLYHNYFGGHVEREAPPQDAAVGNAQLDGRQAPDAARDRMPAGSPQRLL